MNEMRDIETCHPSLEVCYDVCHNGDSKDVMHHEKYLEHYYSWNAYGARNHGNYAKYGMHQKSPNMYEETMGISS